MRRFGRWIAVVCMVGAGYGQVMRVDFEDVALGTNGVYNGSDFAGGFESGGVGFGNVFDRSFGVDFWSGFAVSRVMDGVTPGFGNQYASFSGGGLGGTGQYAVVFDNGDDDAVRFPRAVNLEGVWINNTTYAGLVMRDGDSLFGLDPFGGPGGEEPDTFRLRIVGVDGEGQVTGEVVEELADFRFEDSAQDYVLDRWRFVDLASLGAVSGLRFGLESTDRFMGFNNTPNYFAMDDLGYAWTPTEGEVRLVEVSPEGDYVVISNVGERSVNMADWYMCSRFRYARLGAFPSLGSLVLDPGERVTLLGLGLDAEAADVGIYRDSRFSDPASLVAFMQYGAAGLGREREAVAAGLWTAGEVVPRACRMVWGEGWAGMPCLGLEGVVWEDRRAEGMLGVTGLVVEVRVDEAVIWTAVTGPGGHFAFEAVPPEPVELGLAAGQLDPLTTVYTTPEQVMAGPGEELAFGYYTCEAVGIVTGVVWRDVNGNGEPGDENLAQQGLAGVGVSFLRDGEVLQVVTTGVGGVYVLDPLPLVGVLPCTEGTEGFTIEVDLASLPADVGMGTTPARLSYAAGLEGGGDFGFRGEVDAIGLEAFEAVVEAGGVGLRWRTAWEANNLGFFIGWAPDVVSEPERISGLILAEGNGVGSVYGWLDAGGDGAGVYWLEDLDASLGITRHGPFRAVVPARPAGGGLSLVLAEDGVADFIMPAADSVLVLAFAEAPGVWRMDGDQWVRMDAAVLEVDGWQAVVLSAPAGWRVRVAAP